MAIGLDGLFGLLQITARESLSDSSAIGFWFGLEIANGGGWRVRGDWGERGRGAGGLSGKGRRRDSCGAEGRGRWGHWEGIGEKPPHPSPEALLGAGSTHFHPARHFF